jgi:hypothetical protein
VKIAADRDEPMRRLRVSTGSNVSESVVNKPKPSSTRHTERLRRADRIGTIIGASLILGLVSACANYLS